MNDTNAYDVGVIGAGIEGSSIAHALSWRGLRTILIEQFPLPHTRGSSHGHSRGIRAAYGSKDFMTEMMIGAYPLWTKLEQESGAKIYKQTGLLYFGPKKERADAVVDCLRKHKFPHEVMTEDQVRERWPAFRMYPGCSYVLDKSAGVLHASNALKAYQQTFMLNGGTILDSAQVADVITAENDVITLMTSRGDVRCRKVCVAAGAWTNKILERTGLTIPLEPLRIPVLYWKLKEGRTMDDCPNFIFDSDPESYSVMGDEYPGHVKVCPHDGMTTTPDARDQVSCEKNVCDVQKFVTDCLPYLDGSRPSIMETCMYTMTPDCDYVLDRHPRHRNLFVAAGFSGHGFKMAPIVGLIMADMMTGKPAKYDLAPFRVGRFNKSML